MMTWKSRWVALTAIFSLLLGALAFSTIPGTSAQGVQGLEGAPVDIHEGSCEDFLQEPAYDGGTVEIQSLNELRENDDNVNAGLTEVGNTLGVDVNGDGQLDDTELIGATGEDAQVAVAQADIDGGLDEDTPWVAVVHASEDAYTTTLACGSISEAAEEDGNLIAYIHPLDDASAFGYAVVNGDRTSITTYLFEPGAAPQGEPAAVGADDATPAASAGYPVDIHEGTCTDFTFEPAYDGGLMQVTNVAAEGEQEVGDTEVELPAGADQLGDVYHVDNEADFTGNDLLEAPHVVAVHQGEDDYETIVACGQVFDIPEDDNLIVPLLPVGDSNQTGVAIIPQEGDGEITAFLWACEPLEQQEIATPAPTPEPTPTPTPEPTVVIEETEVVTETEVVEVTAVVTETQIVEETEVITETEVVGAPTATALAQQETQPQQVELGDASPGALTAQVGQTVVISNASDAERVFRVADLGIEETIPAGEQVEITLPDDAEPGAYGYEVLEGDETVFEDELTVEES